MDTSKINFIHSKQKGAYQVHRMDCFARSSDFDLDRSEELILPINRESPLALGLPHTSSCEKRYLTNASSGSESIVEHAACLARLDLPLKESTEASLSQKLKF